MSDKPVTHVKYKDGKTWCGTKSAKDAPFDADACPECAEAVAGSFG